MSFQLKQRVSRKTRPADRGHVDFILPSQGGLQYYQVMWDSGAHELLLDAHLLPEVIIISAWDRLANNVMSPFEDAAIAAIVHKITNNTVNTISTLKASRTIFKPYQYKPLVKFLHSDNKRLLVADEVGLGKTIEAGHILLEMAARKELRTAIVVCTKSLQHKWRTELKDKFNFDFKIYETAKEFTTAISTAAEGGPRVPYGILNYEKWRDPALQKVLSATGFAIDLLICDEAHKMRNDGTQLFRSIAPVIAQAEGVVFLTATPVMTVINNLHSLLRLLDPERYSQFDVFQNAMEQNRPFIRALHQLQNGTAGPAIAEELSGSEVRQSISADEQEVYSDTTTIDRMFAEDALYRSVVQSLTEDKLSPIEDLIRLKNNLMDLNSINHIYCRTRKKDVMKATDIVTRRPHTCPIILHDEEEALYEQVMNDFEGEPLAQITKKRQMCSCIPAYGYTRRQAEQGVFDITRPDSKFDQLQKILDEVVVANDKKLIIFAAFVNTLHYLRKRLIAQGIGCELISGDVDDRTGPIQRFKNDGEVKVLLSSEVGSEGIDLQFCDALVNYDLPWNPMVVEQRIGRIDRIGQLSSTIHIYTLVIAGTIEERILNRLHERINLFRESIGDMEELFGENEDLLQKLEKGITELYTVRLSPEEQEKRIMLMEQAFEMERQNLARVREGLKDAFSNDMHFEAEVARIEKKNQYITEADLLMMVRSILRHVLSTLQLHEAGNDAYTIRLPQQDTSLFRFIEEHMSESHSELKLAFLQFKRRFLESSQIRITFNQSAAYNNRELEYISSYHPLINAAANFYIRGAYHHNQAFKLSMPLSSLEAESALEEGWYVLLCYKVAIVRYNADSPTVTQHYVQALLAAIGEEDEPQLCEPQQADYIMSVLGTHGRLLEEAVSLDEELVKAIRGPLSLGIIRRQNEIYEQQAITYHSGILRRAEQERLFLKQRILRASQQLDINPGLTAIRQKDIRGWEEKLEIVNRRVAEARIEASHEIVSINLIQLT